MKTTTDIKKAPYQIGGQAVIEGVMMRGKKMYTIAVRKPDKTIETVNTLLKTSDSKLKKLPIIRGIVAFGSSVAMGTKIVMKSAEMSGLEDFTEDEPETKFEKFLFDKFGDKLMDYMLFLSFAFSICIALLFFVFLPVWLSRFTMPLIGEQTWALGIIEGFVRIVIFVVYVLAISRMKDIQMFFQYHGAEHKAINCYEDNKELTVENVRSYSPLNKRCGTSFLVIVMIISMALFMFIQTDIIWIRFGFRILLLPVIAGLSYEAIKWTSRHDSLFVNIISFPGMCLQRITTSEPTDSQIEVAIASLNKVIDYEIKGVSWEKINETGSEIQELLAYGKKILSDAEIENSSLDTELLLMKAADISREDIFTYPEKIIDKDTSDNFKRLVEMRAANMPLKYITNNCEFMSLDFYVDKNVLIPRPDTEILVEHAIKEINECEIVLDKPLQVLDLCTGSGCIAVSIAKHCENVKILATDISPSALSIAKRNAEKIEVSDRIEFIKSDILNEEFHTEMRFDVIISNPPYIKTSDIEGLQPDIKQYEPISALDGGADGLDFYRAIASNSPRLLNSGGKLMLEIGFDQSTEVSKLLSENGFMNIKTLKDLSGNDRVVYGEINK